MTTKKKFFAALFTAALMLLVNLTAFATTSNSPYCRISYDSAVGCNTVKYYSFNKKGVASYDSSRLVKFYDGKILLGTSNTLITKKHKQGTNTTWTPDGKYLIWIESDNSLQCRKYGSNKNFQLTVEVSSLGLNAESMCETVTYKNGNTENISNLIKNYSSTKPTEETTSKKEEETTKTSTTSTSSQLKEWTDSAGQEHFQFGKNEVIVDGKDVYFNNFKISELCDSGVKFVGISSSHKVYLYENTSSSYYRFSSSNLFKPEKIKFSSDCNLESVVTNKNGFLTAIKTNKGTFKLSQLIVDKQWYPSISYAVNKYAYCSYYQKGTSSTYVLKLSGTDLYLGKTLVAKGIERKTESFGFNGNNIYYLKGSKVYIAPIKNPKKATIWKQNVSKLKYERNSGLVSGVSRLDTKQDYVKNYKTKSILYQNGKKANTLSISKNRQKVYLNGKVIAKTTSKKPFTQIGFLENGKLFFKKDNSFYKANLSSPKQTSIWSVKNIKRNSLGFTI